ncbi:hypothetical protein HYPSUDRAFT_49319 [Hypholoma sublateritium FD-334 SS-4]|uniref:Uncharacterized protein n=1 Tax=Hypholoma sublateritium (strain FD-334 SS-4) TaxID=945553 RepID=A0A0D2NCJ3_HYPSF|nr:hypothetical protein HYPSUDRAFT_49319 [Hypholoma sublateritium FD-334 SS-4]
MSYPKYIPIFTDWTEDELEKYNVKYKFSTYEEFFGQERITPQFDLNIFDRNLVQKRDKQKVETINFFMHHNAQVIEEDALTDYAFAILWFTGYIATPRHTFRNVVCKYGYQGTSSYIKYNLMLQCGYKTVLFVVVTDSVLDGVSKVLAGALSLSTQYHERRHDYPVFPAIVLVDKIAILAKVTIPDGADVLIGNNVRPTDTTLIELYSPIDIYTSSDRYYRNEELTEFLGAMEAFKRFIIKE